MLNHTEVYISKDAIPEDALNGVSRPDIIDFNKVSKIDKLNTSMFWDGSMDNMHFQQQIQKYQYTYIP